MKYFFGIILVFFTAPIVFSGGLAKKIEHLRNASFSEAETETETEAEAPSEYCEKARKVLTDEQKEPAYLSFLILSCSLKESYWASEGVNKEETKKYLDFWSSVQSRRIDTSKISLADYVKMHSARDEIDTKLRNMSVPKSDLLTAFVASMRREHSKLPRKDDYKIQLVKKSDLKFSLGLLDCNTVDAGMESFSREFIEQILMKKGQNAAQIFENLFSLQDEFEQQGSAAKDCLKGFTQSPLSLFGEGLQFFEITQHDPDDKSSAKVLAQLVKAFEGKRNTTKAFKDSYEQLRKSIQSNLPAPEPVKPVK